MNANAIDNAPDIAIVSPAELEVERKASAGERAPWCARATWLSTGERPTYAPRVLPALLPAPPDVAISVAFGETPGRAAPRASAQGAPPLTGPGSEPVISGGQDATAVLEQLLDRPADSPDLEWLSAYSPGVLMEAAAQVAQAQGNPKRVLRVLVDFLSGQDLTPSYPPRRLGRRPPPPPEPNAWLVALTDNFFTPDILEAAQERYRELTSGIERFRNPARALTPDGRPMPRKRDLDESGNPIVRGRLDHSVSLAGTEQGWEELARRYPRFMLELGEHHYIGNSAVNAYECMARAMLLDFDVWREHDDRLYEMFLDSATFMVLSAHKTDQVMALYDQVPLRLADLQRRIVDQIERRTEIYTRARAEFSNNAAISQALVDLLNTLIEDPSIDDLVPADEKRRFLDMIGEAAIARRRYQEAVGVYASLGDTKRLVDIGRLLSANIYYVNQGVVTISRDIDTAIDAFREAGDTESLSELLARCEAVRDQFAGAEKPANYPYLEQYIRAITDFVAPTDYARSLGFDDLTLDAIGGGSGGADLTADRLPDLITQYLQKMETAVPGQDLTSTRKTLRVLGDRALELGEFTWAVKALEASGTMTVGKRLELGRRLVEAAHYQEAFDIYTAIGEQADSDLVALGQTIVSRGLAPRGILNPDVELAVDAYLVTDESARLEALLNDLLKLRVRFATLEMDALNAGKAPIDRNAEVIERCLRKISEVYDLVGVPFSPEKTEDSKSSGGQDVGREEASTGVDGRGESREAARPVAVQEPAGPPPHVVETAPGKAPVAEPAPEPIATQGSPAEEGDVEGAVAPAPPPSSQPGEGASGAEPDTLALKEARTGDDRVGSSSSGDGPAGETPAEDAGEPEGPEGTGDSSAEDATSPGAQDETPTPVPIPATNAKRASSIYRPVLEP